MSARPFVRAVPRLGALVALSVTLGACMPGMTRGTVPLPPRLVLGGLNSPQGVFVAADGSVWVTDSGTGGDTKFTAPNANQPGQTVEGTYGATGRVVRVTPDGTATDVARTTSVFVPGLEATAGGKFAVVNGAVYVTNGVWNAAHSGARPTGASSVLQVGAGDPAEIASAFAFEAANNPDGVPAEQGGVDSHAYGAAAGPDGKVYVTDAGANTLLRLDPATKALSLVAVFAPLQNPNPMPGMPPVSQAVPTGVAFGNDGAAYVALLTGFPFATGAAKVVRVDVASGAQRDFATNLTLLTDIARGPDGNLYALSFANAFRLGGPGVPYVPNSGSVVRLRADGRKEVVLSGLNYPTGLAFNSAGDAFVAENGLGLPLSGKVVQYRALTRYPAQ